MRYRGLEYDYYNDDGLGMGITTVWLPDENRTVFVYCNDEGCSIMTVDFVKYRMSEEEYIDADFMIDDLPFEDFQSHGPSNKYLEVYRSCLVRFVDDYCADCPEEDGTIELPYELLTDELQQMIPNRDKDYYVTNGREIL